MMQDSSEQYGVEEGAWDGVPDDAESTDLPE